MKSGFSDDFDFMPAAPQLSWQGRYARIVGNTTVFKNLQHKGIVIEWFNEGQHLICEATNNKIEKLAEAVKEAKRALGGNGFGAFLINEFKQVLVPASDGSGNRLLAGEIQGRLTFRNPAENNLIDLSSAAGLKCGDPWEKPYIGMPYSLSAAGAIYFKQDYSRGRAYQHPPKQDHDLIKKLKTARYERYGGLRFVVNPYGVVLTKRETNNGWDPVFVGHIRQSFWFEKEMGQSCLSAEEKGLEEKLLELGLSLDLISKLLSKIKGDKR